MIRRLLTRNYLTGTLPVFSSPLAGFFSTAVSKAIWRRLIKHEPPYDLSKPDAAWKDAILWAGLTGLMGGVSMVVVRRMLFFIIKRIL